MIISTSGDYFAYISCKKNLELICTAKNPASTEQENSKWLWSWEKALQGGYDVWS